MTLEEIEVGIRFYKRINESCLKITDWEGDKIEIEDGTGRKQWYNDFDAAALLHAYIGIV